MEEFKDSIREAFAAVVSGFIVHEDTAEYEVSENDNAVHVCFQVHAADMPKVLGKKRRTYNSIEYLFRMICYFYEKGFSMELKQPRNGSPEPASPFIANHRWRFEGSRLEKASEAIFQLILEEDFGLYTEDDMATTVLIVEPSTAKEREWCVSLQEHIQVLASIIGRREGRNVTFAIR